MAVVQMQRLNLVAMKQNRKAILERIQELGGMQIDIKTEDLEGTSHEDVSTQRSLFDKWSSTADQAIEVLDKYAPEETGLLAGMAGKPLVDRSEYDETVKNQEKYVEEATQIVDLDKQITEASASIQKLENQAETLVPWEKLDVPMNTTGTEKTAVYFGTLPEVMTEEQILTALKTHEPPVDGADVQIFSTDRDMTYLSAVCLKPDAEATEETLREMGFARPSWVSHRTPCEEQEEIQSEIAGYQAAIETYTAQIVEMAPVREHLKLVSDYYRLRTERYDVVGTLPHTANTFALSGYVPKQIAGRLAEELETDYGAAVELEEIDEKEDAPVLTHNNRFSDCVDGVIASYGLPGKGEIDPTVFVSIFYVVMFGMMLSDAGYGLLIVIGCGFVLARFKRMGTGLRKSFKMFFFCGISTVIWGILFGGFFGDLIAVISREFFGHEVVMKPLWFAPIEDPMKLLIFALFIGLIHLFIGLGISGYMLIKQKKYVAFFCDVVAWYMFLIGLIMLLLPSSIYESMARQTVTFGPFLTYLSWVLTIVGAVILLFMAGRRKKKQIGMRLALGVYEIYGITSWLSDWLSYSRLLALGLATGAIAEVVNMIGTMFGSGILKLIIFVVVFIIGHALNMAINVLGAYVHSNRLEYVEFFQKFYEGKGRPFVPFVADTKYVEFAKTK
ncbi:MAG: V-type ATP synthase subunit I [Lachnospiraceae bacterium]|nr:V-type ATP synthase subunit I [Lachnospiraceae bacterium]